MTKRFPCDKLKEHVYTYFNTLKIFSINYIFYIILKGCNIFKFSLVYYCYIFKAIFIVPKFSIQASTLSFQWQDLRFKRPVLAVSFVKATSSSLAGRKITGQVWLITGERVKSRGAAVSRRQKR